jgi:hypothetical protein
VFAFGAIRYLFRTQETKVTPADGVDPAVTPTIPAEVAVDESAQSWDDGTPFGKISAGDVSQLMQFATEQGFDFSSEFQKAYEKDAGALARVFTFSLKFKDLDQNARTYGHTIYSSVLNLGETMGLEQYSDVVTAQSPEVQQRVRDFLYYPVTLAPKNQQAQIDKDTREGAPKLFPKDYEFGRNNPLFKK